MNLKQANYRIMRLPIKMLNVDLYQKKLRKRVIDKIVEKFDPVALGLIHVSLRNDGSYWIFDGQHRVEALKALGQEHVDCVVFTGLTKEQEASGFLDHHNVSKPTKIEEHKGRIFAKDEKALEIELIANELGLRIAAGGMKDTIQSVTTLYDIYDKNGRGVLSNVLLIIRDGFFDEERPYKVAVLKAIRNILVKYKDKVDKKWMIRRLKQDSFDELNNKADAFVKVYGFSKVDGMEMAITQSYNHRKSERLKLK